MSIYFCKTGNSTHACLKIINDKNEELSLAGDDSCGVMKNIGRLDAITFRANGLQDSHGSIINSEDFIRVLADHLGFELKKKERVS